MPRGGHGTHPAPAVSAAALLEGQRRLSPVYRRRRGVTPTLVLVLVVPLLMLLLLLLLLVLLLLLNMATRDAASLVVLLL